MAQPIEKVKQSVKEKAKDRDLGKAFREEQKADKNEKEAETENQKKEEEERRGSSGKVLDSRKKARKARNKARKFKESASRKKRRAEDITVSTRNSVGNLRQPTRGLGKGFLRTAEKLDTARGVFQRNFGETKPIGLKEGSEGIFEGGISPSTGGEEFDTDFFGEKSDNKEKNSDQGLQPSIDVDAGFEFDL